MGWRRFLVTAVAALGLLASGAASAAADEGGTVISFQSMTPITDGAVGAVNDRGLTAGSLPWKITSGSGTVDRDGHVSVAVTGLVLAAGPTTPPALVGKNPIGTFAAVVSCRTTAQQIVNVQTGGVPATMSGDASINTTVGLPHPCTTPEVFVGGLIRTASGAVVFRWFAVSNGDFSDAS
ncbi:MAG TPA: hypothetical protein VFL27_11650 [Candidatus Dormibacteraeota bacterium]|nr:hypothetical protein [Candidatus Dormibacteraeota bacterium]